MIVFGSILLVTGGISLIGGMVNCVQCNNAYYYSLHPVYATYCFIYAINAIIGGALLVGFGNRRARNREAAYLNSKSQQGESYFDRIERERAGMGAGVGTGLGSNWECRFCHTINSGSLSYCIRCRRDRNESSHACPNCGALNANLYAGCKVCGSALLPEAGTPSAAPTSAAPPYSKCANCGAALEPNSKFCNACGSKIESAPPPKCPACGAELAAGSKFCNSCGAKVGPD